MKGISSLSLLQAIGIKVKRQQFYKLYGEQYRNHIFMKYQQIRKSGYQIDSIDALLVQNWGYQLAVYYNQKITNNQQIDQKHLIKLFGNKFTKKGLINLTKIQLVMPNIEQIQLQEYSLSSKEQDNQQQSQQKQSSLLSYLRSQGLLCQSIDFSNHQTMLILMKLIKQYYGKQKGISQSQKNMILNQPQIDLKKVYTIQMLQMDLQQQDYIIGVHLLHCEGCQLYAQKIIIHLKTNLFLLKDILFKELLRLAVSQLVHKAYCGYYKKILKFISKQYLNLIQQIERIEQKSILLQNLNSFILNISYELIQKCGDNKGQLMSIIYPHCILYAELMKEKCIHLKKYFEILLSIFRNYNLYLLIIGIVELITLKEIQYQILEQFISNVLLEIINKKSILSWKQLSIAVGKGLILCLQLLNQNQNRNKKYITQQQQQQQQEQEESIIINLNWSRINPCFKSGIAKKLLIKYFKLFNNKLHFRLFHKYLIILHIIYNNKKTQLYFLNYLSSLNNNNIQLYQEISYYSQIYLILNSITLKNYQNKFENYKINLMNSIINIFPLQLQLNLFLPLLPKKQIYGYLAQQFKIHSILKSNFNILIQVINVFPDQISSEWVDLVEQCVLRGKLLNENCIKYIMNQQILLQNRNYASNYARLICILAQHCYEIILPYLSTAVQIIIVQTQEKGNQFTLALIYKIIISLGELIDPYLVQLLNAAINIHSQYMQTFLAKICQILLIPTLITLTKTLIKTVNSNNCANLINFFKKVTQKGTGDSLMKTLQILCLKILKEKVAMEDDDEQIYWSLGQVFVEIALHLNENKLRKQLVEWIRWSQLKINIDIKLSFNLKKIILMNIYGCLCRKLQDIIINLYGYIFENILIDINNIALQYQHQNKSNQSIQIIKKRNKNNSNYILKINIIYLKIIFRNLQLLFLYDTNHQFIDGIKLDLLCQPLCNVINSLGFEQYYRTIMVQNFQPCIIALYQHITDDYQLKSINYKILLQLKSNSTEVHQTIFHLMQKLTKSLQHRFLIIVNDLVPFLLQFATIKLSTIQQPIKNIIKSIQNISGDKIENYLH